MNTKMTLEEYKKRVEISLKKMYPDITEEEIAETMTIPEEAWEQYMEDFSPEILPAAWAAGA